MPPATAGRDDPGLAAASDAASPAGSPTSERASPSALSDSLVAVRSVSGAVEAVRSSRGLGPSGAPGLATAGTLCGGAGGSAAAICNAAMQTALSICGGVTSQSELAGLRGGGRCRRAQLRPGPGPRPQRVPHRLAQPRAVGCRRARAGQWRRVARSQRRRRQSSRSGTGQRSVTRSGADVSEIRAADPTTAAPAPPGRAPTARSSSARGPATTRPSGSSTRHCSTASRATSRDRARSRPRRGRGRPGIPARLAGPPHDPTAGAL